MLPHVGREVVDVPQLPITGELAAGGPGIVRGCMKQDVPAGIRGLVCVAVSYFLGLVTSRWIIYIILLCL
jgi:hypothetical protein